MEDSARQRILSAARQHFFAHGFRGVTMTDLANELGMSKKTLYAHFPSKTALLEAMLQDKFDGLEQEVSRIAAESATDFLTGLRRLLECIQRQTEEIQPPFLRDIQRDAPELFQKLERRRRELIRRYFGQLLEEGRRAGFIRKDIPVPLMIEILLGAVQAIVNPPRLLELGLTPQTGLSAILAVILEGALCPRGRSKP